MPQPRSEARDAPPAQPPLEPQPLLERARQRLTRLLARLDRAFLEREPHSRLALLSLLSGHHMLMLGPPGTAKSLLTRALCRCLEGGRYFEYLLSRFTHPDELFGPVSIPGLKEEDYRRLTHGYLPDAHVAFLDEVFKANSAILNALLTLINERVFHHGTHRDQVPLRALFGASNEPPESEALAALYDRFLVRIAVQPLASQEHFLQVSLGELDPFDPPPDERLSLEMLEAVRDESRHVTVGPDVRRALVRLREAMASEQLTASDRRWRWAMELVKVAALTSGRRHVEPADLLLLQHCFGTPFETDAAVQRVVARTLVGGAHPDLDLQWLRDAEAELRQTPEPDEPFSAARARRLALLDAISARGADLSSRIDQQRDAFLRSHERSLWVHEVPAEVFTAMLSARNTLRETLEPLRAMAARYRPRLERFSLVGSFFGAFVLQNQLLSVFARPHAPPPLAWVSGPDEPPQRWTGLAPDGQLIITPERLADARARVDADPWHEAVLHITVDDDRLFEVCRRDDWQPTAHLWFKNLWDAHQARGATRLPERHAAARAFLDMLEHYRATTSAERFPLPE